ncbi:MAG: carotenoid oxygenase family protein [Candidatus Zhuqueibacterota bacterium]
MSRIFELGFLQSSGEFHYSQLPMTGNLPDWLAGTLFRNGPGAFSVGTERYRHWFDGLAMLHKFTISHGNVSYANKFLRCDAYRRAQQTGRIMYSEYATDPHRSALGRVFAVFDQRITDSAKVNIEQIAGKYLALGETSEQIQFDPHTLDVLGTFHYEEKYKQHITTVHPQFDFNSNTVYQLVTRFGRVSHYRFVQIDASGRIRVTGEMPVSKPAYMHSFGLSPRYIILTEFPLVVQPLSLLFQVRPFIENFKWKPNKGTTFTVMDRATGKIVLKLKSDAFFAFHHVNAFESGDELLVDINAYADAEVIHAFYLDKLKDERSEIPFGDLRRYRIDLKSKKITHELLSEENLELSNYDYRRFTMNGNYRYVYGVSLNRKKRSGFYNQLVKIDVKTGASTAWYDRDSYPGEPIFVGRPGRTNEDDGVVLSVILSETSGTSSLLVLDAASFTEMARVQVPHPILFGYHGAYFEEIL